MAKQLCSRDNQRIQASLPLLYALCDRERFIERVLSLLQTFISCDYTSYNEINLLTRRARLRWNPPELEWLQIRMQPVFERYVNQHPMVMYIRTTRDHSAVKISDFLSNRNFKKLDLYQQYYHVMGVRHQIGLSLDVSPTMFVPIVLNRSGRDFTERDREILNALRPHLAQAFQNAEAVDRIRTTIATLEQVANEADHGVLEVSSKGKIVWGTFKALKWLQSYWPTRPLSGYIPEPLAAWVQHELTALDKRTSPPDLPSPIVLRREFRTLRVRLVRTGGRRFLLIDEQLEGIPPDRLEPLGLGHREAEVLAWVAQGKTNKEIGTLLSISPQTVKKHLERIFSKLGVETRTAAAAQALDLLRYGVDAAGR